ncbi:amino acid aminotransferase [Pontivivens insulae]|uniref:Aminotransferase n=1 Tax=Pontivivens insulae TaxID=1639689 RepID=A0A2R8ACX4_9RHOB|nr:amino acid aminotransferase [Pontivivens insulae]RED14015.1 aromatic amino acid aminotransferase [Pontivivens insulae]SPF30089.1 Aromatic-amino-acid aminotransferase [Pontivivens insulae]
MFNSLPQPKPDAIIALMAEYAADPRDTKVDLGVGVYKDDEGRTPVMRAVRKAEERLHAAQTTKTYTKLTGDPAFVKAMQELGLGQATDRMAGAAAPGGTGALRVLFELVSRAKPDAKFHISNPSWPSHEGMLNNMGLSVSKYDYFDAETCGVRFDDMLAYVNGLGADDIVVLHGCCHNPTGANLTDAQWAQLTESAIANGWTPLVDLAYQGMGDGLEEDVTGMRHMASKVQRMMVAQSCSKNFGLYRDRAGCATVICPDVDETKLVQATLASVNRMLYSFAPDHGAALAEIILNDPELRADWEAELTEMRERINGLRDGLAEALRQATNSDRFDFIKEHRGMFSRLGVTPEQVKAMRDEAGIYMVQDSRMNIAGLTEEDLPAFARAAAAAGA